MPVNWQKVAEAIGILGAGMQDAGAGIGGRTQGYIAALEAEKRRRLREQEQQRFGQQFAGALSRGTGESAPTMQELAPLFAQGLASGQDMTPWMSIAQMLQPPPRPAPFRGRPGDMFFDESGKPVFSVPTEAPETWRAATPEEIGSRGLPKGSVGQISNKTGQFRSDFTPPQRLLTQEELAQQAQLNELRAPRTTVNVPINTQQTYAGAVAKGLADQDLATLDAARAAPQRMETAQRVLNTLSTTTPITGSFAEQRLAIAKVLSTAGITDPSKVTATEDLASALAGQTLDAIKTSGLGGGQGFTERDREFLELARAGKITINPETLRHIAELNVKAARASIRKGNAIIKRLRSDPSFAGLGEITPIEEPPPPQSAGGFNYLGPE